MDRAFTIVRPLSDDIESLHHDLPSSDQRVVRNADPLPSPGRRINGPLVGKHHPSLRRGLGCGKESIEDARLDQVIRIGPGHPGRLPLFESHRSSLADVARNSRADEEIDGFALQLLNDTGLCSVARQRQYVEVDEMRHNNVGIE